MHFNCIALNRKFLKYMLALPFLSNIQLRVLKTAKMPLNFGSWIDLVDPLRVWIIYELQALVLLPISNVSFWHVLFLCFLYFGCSFTLENWTFSFHYLSLLEIRFPKFAVFSYEHLVFLLYQILEWNNWHALLLWLYCSSFIYIYLFKRDRNGYKNLRYRLVQWL